jgi:hemerythrin-like metal-binding protein
MSKNTILIVDDIQANLQFLNLMLVEQGYQVRLAINGAVALKIAKKVLPDLILLDVRMPKMDGYEVCERLKADEQTRDIPIIFVSALNETVDKVKAFSIGGVDYVSKPFQAEEVLARIETHLNLRQLQKRLEEKNDELEKRNKLLSRVFGHILSNDVIKVLLTESGLALGGERREITVLTSDIRGFTARANNFPPEKVIKLLNFYLTAMVKVINEYQGTINDFIGDGLLVFFGAPIAREDDPERAIACAVAMQLAMDEVNMQLQSRGCAPLEIGIGINTGEVVVGNIGSETRLKYSAIGHGVNLAYRIESYAIGGQILISESTFKKVSNVKIHSEKTIKPKGIKQEIKIYEVEGIAGKYNLYLHKEEEIFLPLQEEISLQCRSIDNKQVSDQSVNGTLFKLSPKGALIRCNVEKALLPKMLNNLKINFNLPNSQVADEDVYAKVLSDGESENALHVHFTSLPKKIKAQLVALFNIEWTPAFSVNHPLIDEQHKELFNQFNKLLNYIGNEEEGKLEILDFLETYIITHFETEETVMKQVDYPDYVAHKAQHTTFIETFKQFKREYEQYKGGHLYLALHIQQKLFNWLVHHVCQSDQKLGSFLSEVNN